MKKTERREKFFIRPLTAVNQFNYEFDLPIYDGVVIYYKTEDGKNIDFFTLYCGQYDAQYTFKSDKDCQWSQYIKTYEDFKELDAAVEKAKYHIELAHKAALTAAYIE